MKNNIEDRLRLVIERLIIPHYPSIISYDVSTRNYVNDGEHHRICNVEYNMKFDTTSNETRTIKNDTRNIFKLIAPDPNEEIQIVFYPRNLN